MLTLVWCFVCLMLVWFLVVVAFRFCVIYTVALWFAFGLRCLGLGVLLLVCEFGCLCLVEIVVLLWLLLVGVVCGFDCWFLAFSSVWWVIARFIW